MFPLVWNFQAMLKLSWDGERDEPGPRFVQTIELVERRQALDSLETSIWRMYWRGRVMRTTVDLKRKRVWKVDGIKVRDGQLYVDHSRPYTTANDGKICPLEWSDLSTEDVKFAALTLGF